MSVLTKRSAIALGLAMLVASCSKPPPPPEPTVAQINVVAAEDANPNPAGQASPTVVLIYAMKPGAPFRIADYDALTGGDMGDLAKTMTRLARFVILPGHETKKVFELPDGVTDIGIAAGYRQVATAKWRAQHPVTAHKVNLLTATVGANQVTLE